MREPRHGLRIAIIWLVLAVPVTLIMYFVWGPHMPPGLASHQSADQTWVNRVLATVVAPIVLFVWVQFGYSIAVFRRRGTAIEDGDVVPTSGRVQAAWIGITGVIVISLAVWASVELLAPGGGGVGGGQGPNPLAVPAKANILQVQVIAQQWQFTFRYPSYGGLETTKLMLPADTVVELHVTSIDVVHSFWAWKLGVKADGVPGNDNIAFVQTQSPTTFSFRCAELCGLFHGQMDGAGAVMSQGDFQAWIQQQQAKAAPIQKYLPPYSRVYYPDPNYRAG